MRRLLQLRLLSVLGIVLCVALLALMVALHQWVTAAVILVVCPTVAYRQRKDPGARWFRDG